MTRSLYKHKDNVAAQLNAGISAATTSIALKTGEGALFPTTANGSATSAGSTTTLNSTGIQALLAAASVTVGMVIENVTDGSKAVIKTISTNSIVTTRLKGGTDNTWDNSDKWHVNRFVVTLINYDTDGTTVLKREKVLIDSRSSDTLTVNTSGRGFDGSTAQSFSSDDYVYLFWTSAAADGITEALAQVVTDVDNLVSQGSGEIYAADGGGTDSYAVTLIPALAAYANGQVINFKANTANTGSASLNVNGLGAKTIYKNNDQTLDDNDIEAAQIVTVVYNSSLNGGSGGFAMQSQIANVFASKSDVQKGTLVYAADAGSNDTYAVTLSPAPTAYTTGMVVHFYANTVNTGAATLNVNSLGAKTIKKNVSSDLSDGDIRAGQIIAVIYDGTNFQILSGLPSQSRLLTQFTTDVFIQSTTTETTVVSVSVPAGTLGTAGVIRGKFKIKNYEINNTNTMTLRLKYGATTVATLQITSAYNPSTDLQGEVEFELYASGATNTKEGSIILKAMHKGGQNNYITDTAVFSSWGFDLGTSAEDSTAAKTLAFTAQFSNSSATNQIRFSHGTVEIL